MSSAMPEDPVGSKNFSCIVCRTRKIRCDNLRPSCSTCTKNHQLCQYIAPRRRRVTGRRNVKAIEDRLSCVQGQNSSETVVPISRSPPTSPGGGLRTFLVHRPEQHRAQIDAEMSPSSHDSSFTTNLDFGQTDAQLPNINCMRELNQVYFDKVHPAIPVLHKHRYLSASASSAVSAQPSLYLRYAVWTIATTVSEKYEPLENQFYQRARRYVQEDEMNDSGQGAMSMDHVRFWVIIAEYETRKMSWNRAWTSTGRISRLSQLIGLHCIDDPDNPPKHPGLRDWTDCEAGRRLFWYAYCMDRYSAVITGRPLTFNEEDILTNLPSNDASFLNCTPQVTASLATSRSLESTRPVSPFGIAVICAAIFGDLARHMHRKESERDQNDVVNGAFWKRHWSLDAEIVKLQIVFPQMLRSRTENEEVGVLGVRVIMQALLIGLYKAAALKAEKFRLGDTVINQSTARCVAAAEEVVKAIQNTGYEGISKWPAFTTFCVHMAIDILTQSVSDPYKEHQSRHGLQIILTFLLALQKPQPFLKSLLLSTQSGLKYRPVLENVYSAPESVNETGASIDVSKVPAATSQHQPNAFHDLPAAEPDVDYSASCHPELFAMPSSSFESLLHYDTYLTDSDNANTQPSQQTTNFELDFDPSFYQEI